MAWGSEMDQMFSHLATVGMGQKFLGHSNAILGVRFHGIALLQPCRKKLLVHHFSGILCPFVFVKLHGKW